MRNIFWIFVFVTAGVATVPVEAQVILAGNLGTSWLKISPSTRNAGMGNSIEAVPDAYDEVDLNPAGLGLFDGAYISLSQDFWAQDLSAQHLVFTGGSSGGDGFSLGVNYMSFGNISTYGVSGSVLTSTGGYSPIGLNVYAGYGLGLGNGLRAGLTGHFIYDNIQQNFPDQTGSLDAGLFYQIYGLSFSAVMTNLGWNIDNSTLPLEVKTGAAYQFTSGDGSGKPSPQLTLSGEADWFLNNDSYNQFGLGLEYWFENIIALRAGYQFSTIGDLTGLTGLSLGAGINVLDWQLDYALVTLGDLGIANQIGLSLKLGGGETPTPTASPTPVITPTSTPAEELQIEAPSPENTPPPFYGDQPISVETSTPTAENTEITPVESIPAITPVSTLSLNNPHSPDILAQLSLHFDVGSIDLQENDRTTVLSTLVKSLEQYQNVQFILIAGYADIQKINPGAPYKSNQELSVMRANALKKYLVANGIDGRLIVTRGYGVGPSPFDGVTQTHFNNRRIEIFIYSSSTP